MIRLDQMVESLLDTLGNPYRLKILLALSKVSGDQELTVYKICRLTGLKRETVARHLRRLVESGLVTRKVYGTVSLYTLSRGNPEVDALTNFFIKARL